MAIWNLRKRWRKIEPTHKGRAAVTMAVAQWGQAFPVTPTPECKLQESREKKWGVLYDQVPV